jgi:DNA-binding MarR family transcriptional regulator
MQPSRADVEAMVAALFTVNAGLERGRLLNPGAVRLGLLEVVAAHPNARPSDLAHELHVNASLISRQVQALELAGYLAVSADPEDHRAWRVALTPVGAEEHRRLHEHGVDRYVSFVADWEADEVATFTRLLSKFEASKRAAVEQVTRQTRRSRRAGLRSAMRPSGMEAQP